MSVTDFEFFFRVRLLKANPRLIDVDRSFVPG